MREFFKRMGRLFVTTAKDVGTLAAAEFIDQQTLLFTHEINRVVRVEDGPDMARANRELHVELDLLRRRFRSRFGF